MIGDSAEPPPQASAEARALLATKRLAFSAGAGAATPESGGAGIVKVDVNVVPPPAVDFTSI